MKVPSPGESISEVEIAEWLVENGDYVTKDQAIAEIDSDKATLELPAEESGIINIIVSEGETVSVGDVVCHIDTSFIKEKIDISKDADVIAEKKEKNNDKSIKKLKSKVTPLASAMISDLDISEDQLKGTGSDGKITKNDVLALESIDSNENRKYITKKMSSLRRKISSRLVAVKNETAMLTTFNEVDMTEIFKIREIYKESFKKKHKVNLGFMSFLQKQ